MSSLQNYILNQTARQTGGSGRYNEVHGLVTSYDPIKHRAKVMLMPHEIETDWLPCEVGQAGAGFGHVTGLTPGDGSTTGDQVVCRPQGGDIESMKIVQRVHSDVDNPPMAKSAEHIHHNKFGQRVFHDEKGQITQETGNVPQAAKPQPGMTDSQVDQMNNKKIPKTKIFQDKDGNVTVTTDAKHVINAGTTVTHTAKSTMTHNSSGHTIGAPSIHLGTGGGIPSAMRGTIDTAGHADIVALSSITSHSA